MNSKKLVVGNWKMNLVPKEAKELVTQIANAYNNNLKKAEVWVTPPALDIPAVAEVLNGTTIRYGSQNAYFEDSGAFTGELSIPMLSEVGASFAIVGHSERRHIFGESNEQVAQRAVGLLKKSFTTILCVGEMLPDREAGRTNAVLETQLTPVLNNIDASLLTNLVIAYEPVWAIGTGKVATIKEIEDAHAFIDQTCRKALKECPPILYGGSVKPNNFAEIIAVPRVSGALVGGASLSFEPFKALIDIAEQH